MTLFTTFVALLRYRDLMEAADTITKMKTGSQCLISNLERVLDKSKALTAKASEGKFKAKPAIKVF